MLEDVGPYPVVGGETSAGTTPMGHTSPTVVATPSPSSPATTVLPLHDPEDRTGHRSEWVGVFPTLIMDKMYTPLTPTLSVSYRLGSRFTFALVSLHPTLGSDRLEDVGVTSPLPDRRMCGEVGVGGRHGSRHGRAPPIPTGSASTGGRYHRSGHDLCDAWVGWWRHENWAPGESEPGHTPAGPEGL